MIGIFCGYLILTMAVGLIQSRKTKSQSDFVIGSSKIPGYLLALSERATGESAWLFLGFTGFIYSEGLSGIWIAVGCLAGIISAWVFIAPKFRQEAQKYSAITMPEYFSSKFPDSASLIRVLSTIIIVFFFIFYVGAQFAGAGKTIFKTFGLDPVWGQIISAVVILTYCVMGGFLSVVTVDALQSILMITTLIVAPLVMVIEVVAKDINIIEVLSVAGKNMGSLWGGLSGITAFLTVFNNFAWFFGYLGGQPQLNARFMGMKDEKNVKVGRNIAIAWTILAYSGAIFIGVCALALFGRNAVTDTEMILPHAIMKIFPWWISAILLAGIVAAMVSTAESMLIVCATSISQDFYNGILKKGKSDEKTVLRISRLVTLGVGLLGLGLSLSTSKLIYTVVGYAWAGIGCSFAPAVLLSFFWKKMNGAGIVTALGAGLVTTVIWILTGLDSIVTARGVTFFVSLASAILVSILFNRKKSQKSICL